MHTASQAIIAFLEKNGWLNDLADIISDLREYSQKNAQKVTVSSPTELNNEEKQEIMNKLKNKYGTAGQNIDFVVDKTILGGLTIKMGDNIIDLSVNTILERIS